MIALHHYAGLNLPEDRTLQGSDADESFAPGAGNDYVYGGGGRDTIDGGDGNDHLYGYGATAGPDGADSIMGGGGDDYIQGNAGADTIDGGDGADRIQGGADDDLIFGGAGADSVNGNLGADTIRGGDGDDLLRGGKNNDRIFGDAGNDTLSGDLGNDTLTGGAGSDVFRFAGGDAALVDADLGLARLDTVTDFTDGIDRLALGFSPASILHGSSALTFAGALTVAQALFAATPGGGEVASVQVGGDTLLFYGAGGGLLVDSAVRLQGMQADLITGADFI